MTITATPATTLSVAMRDGSREQHDAAESSVFVEELMGGKVNAAGYVNYLRSLHTVYAALEEVGATLADDPIAGVLIDSRLDRLAAIEADIAEWSTGSEDETLVPGEAATAYADLIRSCADSPERYIAHHYTRYLGDLSGGQVIGRLLDREFELDGRGIAFYRFEQIEKTKPYKDDYRVRLDSLELTYEQRAVVVTEVQRSFSGNQAIFAELGSHLAKFAR